MELDYNKVQELSSTELYNILKPSIKSIKSAFKYIKISDEDFNDLVIREINDSKKTFKGNQSYEKYIRKKIIIRLSEKVNKLLSDNNAEFDVLNSYISQKFKDINNVEDALKSMQKFSEFLEIYNYVPTPELINDLINQNVYFNKMLELIFNKYSRYITSGKIEEIINNSTLLSIIDTYCILNGIEIKETYDVDLEKYSESYNDDVRFYLNEIGKRPLLSIEQEKELSSRVAKGDTEARNLFIESNLKLVVSVARKYLGRGLSFLDLIQEGNFGLMTAVDKYDANMGCKFSTYAVHWIRQSISRAIADKSRNVRVPVHMYEKIRLYKKTTAELESKLCRFPTQNEIAKEMGLSVSNVVKIQKAQEDTVSMNTIVGNEEEAELGDFISSDDDSPEDIALNRTLKPQIKILFEKSNLTPKEIDVLMLRCGFNNRSPMTLEEVGKKYNITRERVRQIEAKALMKIRRSGYAKELVEFTEYPNKALQNIDFYIKKYAQAALFKANLKPDNKTTKDSKKIEDKEKKKMPPKLRTIYEYFKEYTKEQINEAITKLNDEEKSLLKARYGENLDNNSQVKMTQKQKDRFYGYLVPKIRRILENPEKEVRSREQKQNETSLNSQSESKEIEEKNNKEQVENQEIKEEQTMFDEQKSEVAQEEKQSEIKEQIIKENSKEDETQMVQQEEQKTVKISKKQIGELFLKATSTEEQNEKMPKNNEMTKEDYIKILELLKTPSFKQLIGTLSVKEAVIISLKLGYIDGKYFSTESISEFLGIEPIEVIETVKKVLLVYKENINDFLDKAIMVATEDEQENDLPIAPKL